MSLPKAKKDGSLPDEGLHSSALAWLLHGRELPGEQPLTELGNHLAGLNGGSLRLAIERLVATSDGRMACLPLESREASTQGSSRAAPPEQLAQLNRSLYSAWRIGSFSGLAAGMHMEAPDRDALAMPDAGEPGSGFFAFHAALGPVPVCMPSSRTGHGARASWPSWSSRRSRPTACRWNGRR